MDLMQLKSIYESGELHKALNHLLEIEPQFSKENPQFFDLKLLKAKILLDVGELERDEKLLNSLLDLARRHGTKLVRLDIIILFADILWRKGDWEQTIFMIEMGEYDFTKLDSKILAIEKGRRYANLKRLKGIYSRFTGELDLALEYFNESLVEAEETKDERLIAEIFNLVGLIHHEQGDLPKSWNYYIQSFQLRKKINDKAGMCESVINLGNVQEYIGELDAAIENYQHGLTIAEEINNRRLKGICLGNIGVLYQKKGEFDIAFEYLSKSLAIKSDTGNDSETSWTLYRITNLLLNSKRKELAPIFLDGLEDLNRNNPHNLLISQHYRLIKATTLKKSSKTIDKAEAQQIFYNIINETVIDHELTIYAMLNHCDLLLIELQNTADPDILDEIEEVLEILDSIVTEQHSFPLMIEIYILQAKYATLELDYPKALSLFNQASQMAEEKKIDSLIERISEDYQQLLVKVEEINAIKETDAHLIASVERTELEEEIAELIKEKKREIYSDQEIPILFLIVSNEGRKLFTKQFEPSIPINDNLIKSFIQAINSMIKETFPFPKPVERIQHGEFTVLSRDSNDLLFIYVYKGRDSYKAVTVLDNVISSLKQNNTLLQRLKKQEMLSEMQVKVNSLIERTIT